MANYLTNYEMYGPYVELVKSGSINISALELNKDNFEYHYRGILNIMLDGIETPKVHNMKIMFTFADGITTKISIMDYWINLILWNIPIAMGEQVVSSHFTFVDEFTQNTIKKFVDTHLIYKYRTSGVNLNMVIDNAIYRFADIDSFAFYMMNTINNEDTIDLMNSNPEFYEALHLDLDGLSVDEVNKKATEYNMKAIEIIKNSNHCLADSFKAREGVNPKQYREFMINIGASPDGSGGILPHQINRSYSQGGAQSLSDKMVDGTKSRLAEFIKKNNVGISGHLSRILGLNNQETRLHPDPNYSCNTKRLIPIEVKNSRILELFKNRYYRFNPNGLEYCLTDTPSKDNPELIGQKIWFRSPQTCASKEHGEGICYKCYGKLAYTNYNINIGRIAAEVLGAQMTQKLLSAKHLLESSAVKVGWNKEFSDYFDVVFNLITIKEDIFTNNQFKGFSLVIDAESVFVEDEYDDHEYNEYITSFIVRDPLGTDIVMSIENGDNIYIAPELSGIIQDYTHDDRCVIPFDVLNGVTTFLIKLSNNEISKTLDTLKNTINRQRDVLKYDLDSWLQSFAEIIIDGGIHLDAVHAEVILSNQIRSKNDILETPDWEYPNEEYQLLTLDKSLMDNPSVAVSLLYQKLPKSLYNPLTFKKHAARQVDYYFMEQPNNVEAIPFKDEKDHVQLLTPVEGNDNEKKLSEMGLSWDIKED